jgi:hypothetical protein
MESILPLNGADYILLAAAALDLLAIFLSVIAGPPCLPARDARPKGANPTGLLRFLGIDGVLVADPSSSSSVFGLQLGPPGRTSHVDLATLSRVVSRA